MDATVHAQCRNGPCGAPDGGLSVEARAAGSMLLGPARYLTVALPGALSRHKESNVTRVLRAGPARASLATLAALLMVLAMGVPGFANQGRGPSGDPGSRGNPTPGPQQSFELTILHINDGESALLPTDDVPGVARFAADLLAMQAEGDAPAQVLPPQASARARAIQQHRNARASVTISSGDNFLAGPRLNASLDDPDAFYDALVYTHTGFDAMTIGNHEFDFGPDVLADFIEATGDIPFLSANLDFSGEPRLAELEAAGRIAASTVVEKAGREIGIIGATYEELDTISSPRNVVTSAVFPAVQAEADRLTAEGVDIIILSSHLQNLDTEIALVPMLRNIDVVIGGGGGEALGENYPLLVEDAEGRMVPVVTTPGDYADIGRLVVHFDADGDIVKVGDDSALVPVPLEGPRDPFIAANVEAPVAAYVAGLAANVLGTTTVPLDARRGIVDEGVVTPGVRSRETNAGDLLADALLYAARDRAPGFGAPQADFALQNGGGMRIEAIIPPGPITELTTFDIAAFANFVSVIEIPVETLRAALERSVAVVPGGQFGQWSEGITFTYDLSAPVGSRIVSATVTTAGGDVVDVVVGGVTQPYAGTFTLATNDFTARGGDAYPFGEFPLTTLGVTYQQALAERISALGTITADNYPDLTVDFDRYRRFGPVGGTFIP
jgi:2',3'-cyclic-nucleotide 2'-phosphodiesterase (5'-nucleotidase family)